MATSINTQGNQAPNVSQGSSNAGNGLMQISCGPAALAQLLIYQIMALYAKIIEMDQQQKINMTKAQSAAAQGNAAATVAGGSDMMTMYITMGVLGITGAALGFANEEFSENFGTTKALKESQSEALEKLTPMKDMEELLPTIKPAQGQGGEFDGVASSQDVQDRMDEFMSNDFKNVKPDPKETDQTVIAKHKADTEEAIARIKAKGLDQNDEFDYNNWKQELRENTTDASRNYNSAVQSTSAHLGKINNRTQTLTQVSNFGQNIAQGVQNPKKAQHDAQAALSQTTTQMAGSVSGDFGQAANKAYEAQNAEIQVLENINRTNSANG